MAEFQLYSAPAASHCAAMSPSRHIFAEAEKRQVGPKNPWVFRALLFVAVLAVAALAQIIEPNGLGRLM